MATITEIDATRFSEMLDQAARKMQKSFKPRPQRSFHASSGFKCGLNQYWKRIGQTPTNERYEPENQDDADLGTAYHEILELRSIFTGKVVKLPAWEPDKADKDGMQPAVEVPFNEKTMTPTAMQRIKVAGFGAKIDQLIYSEELRSDGSPQVAYLDFKTKGVKDFLPGNQKYLLDDLCHYEWQLQMCIELAEFPTIGKIDFGLIYLVSRDKDPVTKKRFKKLYIVEPDPLFVGPELERLETLNGKVLRLQQPEPEPHRGSCSFCEFYDLCPVSELDKKVAKE